MDYDYSNTLFRCKLDNSRVVKFGNVHTMTSYVCEHCGFIEEAGVKKVKNRK